MTGSSVASNLGSMPTTIGSSLAIAPLAYPLVEHKDFAGRRIVSLLLFLLAITLFMNSSLFPWRTRLPIVGVIVSFLAKIQFSWRFLSIATLLLATISVIALAYWEKKSRMASVIILALAISFSTVEALYGITSWVGFNDLVDTTSIIKTGKGIFDAQFIPADNYKNQPNYSISVPQTTNSNQSISSFKKRGTRIHLVLESKGKGAVLLPLLYYPGYQIQNSDSNISATLSSGAKGQMQLNVNGKGKTTIDIAFVEPPVWRLAEITSLVTALALLMFYTKLNRSRNKMTQLESSLENKAPL